MAQKLNTVWVPEYARAYLEQLGSLYQYIDLERIAMGQLQLQRRYEMQAQQYLICDTDLYVIKVWSEHRYGTCATSILNAIATEQYNLYLLTGIDIPWQDDPLREHPSEEMRSYFYKVYQDIVIHSGRPWVAINGTPEQRLRTALQAVQRLTSLNP